MLGVGMPTFSKVFSTDADVLNVIKGLIPVCIIFCYFTFILWLASKMHDPYAMQVRGLCSSLYFMCHFKNVISNSGASHERNCWVSWSWFLIHNVMTTSLFMRLWYCVAVCCSNSANQLPSICIRWSTLWSGWLWICSLLNGQFVSPVCRAIMIIIIIRIQVRLL